MKWPLDESGFWRVWGFFLGGWGEGGPGGILPVVSNIDHITVVIIVLTGKQTMKKKVNRLGSSTIWRLLPGTSKCFQRKTNQKKKPITHRNVIDIQYFFFISVTIVYSVSILSWLCFALL